MHGYLLRKSQANDFGDCWKKRFIKGIFCHCHLVWLLFSWSHELGTTSFKHVNKSDFFADRKSAFSYSGYKYGGYELLLLLLLLLLWLKNSSMFPSRTWQEMYTVNQQLAAFLQGFNLRGSYSISYSNTNRLLWNGCMFLLCHEGVSEWIHTL